jgi:signal transduction histidine kinase
MTRNWAQWGKQLYVRIWLAVVLAVAVLTLLVGWAWRWSAEPPLRELRVRNDDGVVIGTAQRLPGSGSGRGPEFTVTLNDGRVLHVHLPRPPARSPFANRPYGFLWLLAMVGVAVALATYPIVRRLTRRLERLQDGVEQWGTGNLSARVALDGDDEVGALATRFNHAAVQIEALVASHKALLANASHELRSPLARIRMGLELMSDSGVGAPSPSIKAELTRSINELDQLVDEILLASRLDSQQADMGTIEMVDLTGLVAEECARVDAVFGAHTEMLDPLPISVLGVDRLLRRAVRNLLENARRYSPGEVRASLVRDGGRAVLRVHDDGPGVPRDQRERIFEPFYRLPGASEQSGGVGLGLALVKSITQRMGGSVHCEDSHPAGACFVVSLPMLSSSD